MAMREPLWGERLKKICNLGWKCGILTDMNIDSVSSPIEQGRTDGVGEPWAIARHGRPLSDRQQALLDKLPGYDSRVTVNKSDVSMTDLAALTAKTGDEFAMFTLGSERLIVRGNAVSVNIDAVKAAEMNALGYRWSGHTHTEGIVPSMGDKLILRQFKQSRSSIYNAEGQYNDFIKI